MSDTPRADAALVEQLAFELNEARQLLDLSEAQVRHLITGNQNALSERDQWRDVARMFKDSKVWNEKFAKAYAAFEALEKVQK